jgi:hypothetical protein
VDKHRISGLGGQYRRVNIRKVVIYRLPAQILVVCLERSFVAIHASTKLKVRLVQAE